MSGISICGLLGAEDDELLLARLSQRERTAKRPIEKRIEELSENRRECGKGGERTTFDKKGAFLDSFFFSFSPFPVAPLASLFLSFFTSLRLEAASTRQRQRWPTAAARKERAQAGAARPLPCRCPDHRMPTKTLSLPPPSLPRAPAPPRPCSRLPSTG